MYRKSEEHNSSDRLLQSKYGQKERQRAVGLLNIHQPKVMLSDLCPEQKLKIGELIKINESRRQLIQELNEQLVSVKAALAESQSALIVLQQNNQDKEAKIDDIVSKINAQEKKCAERDLLIEKLETENKIFKDDMLKKGSIKVECRSVQTEEIARTSCSSQTKEKKMKTRSIQTEVQSTERPQIKRKRSENRSQETESQYQRTDRKQQAELNKNSRVSSSNNIENRDINSTYLDRAGKTQYDMDDCFEDLTKKWLELKEKSLSKLKAQYEESKFKFPPQSELTVGQLKSSAEEGESARERSDSNQIDEVELNKMLKSKNFSASRLLTAKGLMGESQSSRKKSSINQSSSKMKAPEKSEIQAEAKRNYNLSIRQNGKSQSVYKEGRISSMDVGETDLMDLVDSLS